MPNAKLNVPKVRAIRRLYGAGIRGKTPHKKGGSYSERFGISETRFNQVGNRVKGAWYWVK